MQLTAELNSGAIAIPQITNPDGTQSPFVIPEGNVFVVTDISVQRASGGRGDRFM